MIDKIEEALKDWLLSLSLTTPLPYAFPNVEFFPPDDGSGFIDVTFVWSDNRRLSLGSAREYRGQLVMVLALPSNQGTLLSSQTVEELKELFPSDFKLPLAGGGHVRITEEPSARSGYKDDPYWRTPLVVPFQSIVS